MKSTRIRSKSYNLHQVTGKVIGKDKNIETTVSGGGGGGYNNQGTGFHHPVQITSSTTIHDHIFLKDDNNQEHSFRLSNFDVACIPDQKLTVVWAIKEGNQNGSYVAVKNHNTNQLFMNEETIRTICNPKWRILPFLAVAIISIILAIGVIGHLTEGQMVGVILNLPLLALGIFAMIYMYRSNWSTIRKFKSDISSCL